MTIWVKQNDFYTLALCVCVLIPTYISGNIRKKCLLTVVLKPVGGVGWRGLIYTAPLFVHIEFIFAMSMLIF